ncbi:MAG: type VI secretion system-associated FHA domain protein TagH, partial [Rubrivivax sp.]
DWDPFASDAPDAAAPPPAAGDPLRDLVRAAPQESSLDELFGLGATAADAGGDPLAGLGAPAPVPGGRPRADTDLLAAFGVPPPAPVATAGDLGSELNTPMPLVPAPARPAAPARPPPPVRASVPNPTVMPRGAVLSWGDDDEPGHTRVVTTPGMRRVSPAAPPRPSPPANDGTLTEETLPTPRQQPNAPAPASAPTDALLAALLDGLATPDLRLTALTPDGMRLLGQLLREATRGSVELLSARAALKREMRADVTMIGAQKNNPLKFSPTVEAALQHLLGPQVPGFMAPAPAMRDAFDDLRAHQLGVMAGMRAALEGVLGRFDPAQLESQLAQRGGGGLSALLPSGRKARLWELFQQLFTQLQREAQDDFDELFGKAFLRAYEAQLDRLGDEPGPR